MKVLFFAERSWCGLAPAGGAETMARDLMHYLNRAGHETTAIVTDGLRTEVVIDGTKVFVAPEKELMHDLIDGADLVLTHLGGTVRARPMGAAHRKPVVQLIHNTSHYSVGFLGDGCDYALYNSDWVRDEHEARKSEILIHLVTGGKSETIRTRRCFGWPSMVLHPPVMSETIKTNPVPIEDQYITLINLVPNKGPDVFYKLAEMNPQLKFMAVIGGYEPADQDIRDLPNVRIREHALDVDEVYAETSVLLVPSVYESYGRVAIEAAQWGIPTIASPTPGLKEALAGSGLHVDREDIEGWNRALHATLSDYEGASVDAYARFAELYDQSNTELAQFEQEMQRVVDTWE